MKTDAEGREMVKGQIRENRLKVEADSFGMKFLIVLVGLMAAGIVVCVILAILKVAIQAMVIVAAILFFLALCGVIVYNYAKDKIYESRHRDEAREVDREDREFNDL